MLTVLTPVIILNAAVVLLACGVYAWRLNPRSPIHRALCGLCLLLALGVGSEGLVLFTTHAHALWHRLAWIGWALYPAVAVHLALVLTENRYWRRLGWWGWGLLYLPALAALTLTLFYHVSLVLSDASFFALPPWTAAYVAYQYAYDLVAIGLIGAWGQASGSLRKLRQAQAILAAASLALLLGISHGVLTTRAEYLMLWGVQGLLFGCGLTVAFARYRFITPTTELAASHILHQVHDLVCLLATDGTIQRANAVAQTLLGAPEETLFRQPFTAYVAMEDSAKVEELFRTCSPITSTIAEIALVPPSGNLIPLSASCTCLHDEFGEVVGLVLTGEDLRQQRRLERAIRERELAEAVARGARDALEEQVRQRTAELAHANEELQHEIHQRQAAQLSLQQQYHFLEQLIDTIPNPVLCRDTHGCVITCNRAFARQTGLERAQAAGRRLTELVPQEWTILVEESDAQLHAAGGPISYEAALHPPGDLGLQMIVYADTFTAEDGAPGGMVSVFVEITERRRMEDALRLSEMHYRQIFETIQDVFFRMDLEGCLLLVSPSVRAVTGAPPAEIVGRGAQDLGFDAAHVAAFLQAVHAQGRVDDYEASLTREDGTSATMAISAHLMTNEGREPLAIEGVMRDITARKQAEEGLRHSQQLLNRAQQIAGIGSWELNLATNAAVWTEQMYRLFGFSPETFTPTFEAIISHIHQNDRQRITDAVQQALRTGEPYEIEHRICTVSGETRVILAHAEVLGDDQGQARWLIGTALDITDRKAAEATIHRYEEDLRGLALELHLTQEHERRKLANDLHDQICQPLVFARMKVQTLMQVREDAVRAEMIRQVSASLEQLINLTDTLTFALSPPVLHELGFEAAVEWLADEVRREHGLQVQVEMVSPPLTLDDEMRIVLFRMLQELLANVVKHAQARHVSIALLATDEGLQIDVTDDGLGMDNRLPSQQGRGGFGLFSMQERLRYFHGRLEIASAPGSGTCVSLILPLPTVSPKEGPHANPHSISR